MALPQIPYLDLRGLLLREGRGEGKGEEKGEKNHTGTFALHFELCQ